MRCTSNILEAEELCITPGPRVPAPPRAATRKTAAFCFEADPDPVRFAHQLGITPDDKQTSILSGNHHRLIVNCCRQWGKSTVAAAKALHLCFTHPGSLVLVVGPTRRQSGLLVEKVEAFVRRLGIRVRGDGDNEVSVLLSNGSRIVGLPGASDANIRGFSAAALLIVDEASRVHDDLYYAARPILAASGGAIWLLSTPWGKKGFFYDEWTHGAARWERVSVPATECPRIPAAHLEEERATMGDDWVRQEYLCEFVDIDGTVFQRDLIDQAFSADARLLGEAATVPSPIPEIFIGVDLGQKHDFSAIAVIERSEPRMHYLATRQLPASYHLRHLERIPLGTPYPRVVERIGQLANRPEFAGRATLVLDGTSVGVPVVDLVRQARLDCHFVPVTITGGDRAHTGAGGCSVPKRDLINTLEVMLEQHELRIAPQLPERLRLVEELMAMRSNTLRAAGRTHDDLVLALSLACWQARRNKIGHQGNRLL